MSGGQRVLHVTTAYMLNAALMLQAGAGGGGSTARDAARKAWVSVPADAHLMPRAHYAVALASQRLLVWGGWAKNMGVLGDGATLDIARKSWKKMSAAGAPSPRLAPTAVAWTGSRLL